MSLYYKTRLYAFVGFVTISTFTLYSLSSVRSVSFHQHLYSQIALRLIMRFHACIASISSSLLILLRYNQNVGTAVAQWLRFCARNRKVAGSIPAGVIGIFRWHKIFPIALWPWGRLSLEQKWAFPGGKGGRGLRLTTLPPSCFVMKSGNL